MNSTKNRTGLYYLSLLNKVSQIQFCKHRTNWPNEFSEKCPRLSDYLKLTFLDGDHFIDAAFVWSSTDEGHDFWSDKARELKRI